MYHPLIVSLLPQGADMNAKDRTKMATRLDLWLTCTMNIRSGR